MKYLILGGNATGMSAASRLRKNDPNAEITVIEKSDIVSFGACGLPYFVGHEFEDANEMIARPYEAFIKSGINVLVFHEATAIDPTKKTVCVTDIKNEKEIIFEYDKLLISTGASPINPPFPKKELKGIQNLTTIHDGIQFREAVKSAQNITIIGGGFIGIEVAEALVHQGKNVTLIEKMPRLMARVFDKEMTDHMEESIRKHGVNLVLEEGVSHFEGTDHVQAVVTDKNSYPADLVLMAVGFRPATDFCKNIGLEMLGNGAIIIDEHGQTSIKDIYAGGDCAGVHHAVNPNPQYIPLATTANKIGRILGDVLVGKNKKIQTTLGSSAIRFMNLEMARTGLTEQEAQDLGLDYGTNLIKDYNHTSYVPNRKELQLKLIFDKKTRVILGAQISGEKDAVLRINALAVAIFKNMTVDELGMMDFVYSPPFARTWDIMNIAGNTAR